MLPSSPHRRRFSRSWSSHKFYRVKRGWWEARAFRAVLPSENACRLSPLSFPPHPRVSPACLATFASLSTFPLSSPGPWELFWQPPLVAPIGSRVESLPLQGGPVRLLKVWWHVVCASVWQVVRGLGVLMSGLPPDHCVRAVGALPLTTSTYSPIHPAQWQNFPWSAGCLEMWSLGEWVGDWATLLARVVEKISQTLRGDKRV